MIDHRTIGSGDEPPHVCKIVDPLPGDRQQYYAASRIDQNEVLALFIIQCLTLPKNPCQ